MKRAEQIITMTRQLTGNTRYSSDSGIPQSVFVQFLNNAQDSLMKEVVNIKTKFLKKEVTVPVVSGQISYDYPSDLYMQHIDTIQYRDNLVDGCYQPLYKSYDKERVVDQIGYPFGYILQNEGYKLNPPITNGYLVINYIKQLPRLQIKNGQISAVTINGSNQITALTVSTSGSYDSAQIDDDYFLCVVDKYGVQKAKNIEYQSQTGGVFTLSAQTLGSGETVSVGDYITVGKNTVNLPQWPDICESYFLKHMTYDTKFMDASQWSDEAKADMAGFFQTLVGSFATLSDDLSDIAITNTDYIGF